MKKTVLLLQMMEHPEDYSAQQWKEILSDKECLELYTLSCKVRGIIAAKKNNVRLTDGDISEEWEKIQKEYRNNTRIKLLWGKIAAVFIAAMMIAGLAVAAISEGWFRAKPVMKNLYAEKEVTAEKPHQKAAADSLNHKHIMQVAPKLYDNVPLEDILSELSTYYHVKVDYQSENVRSLRLYFKWNPSDSIGNVIEMLNHFESVNLSLNGNELIVK
jgi:hypothetical protein